MMDALLAEADRSCGELLKVSAGSGYQHSLCSLLNYSEPDLPSSAALFTFFAVSANANRSANYVNSSRRSGRLARVTLVINSFGCSD